MRRGIALHLFCEKEAKWRDLLGDALELPQSTPGERGGETRPAGVMVLFDALSAEVLAKVADVSQRGRERTIAVATSPGALDMRAAWRLLAAGASDVLVWTDDGGIAAAITARLERWAQTDDLLDVARERGDLVGDSPRWLACLRQVVEVAVYSDGPVLLLGESGTGKELLARLVHELDPRSKRGELVVLDCTTIVSELSGSEFFGHERGAFTGAAGARDGAFALADGGTLFLDEVGELPPPLQAQLLRVVQERMYKRVGSNAWHHTNFRLVCATHRDLRQDVETGRFRADFYHRIASRVCRLPPLRERREDILPLTRHFLNTLRPGERPAALDSAVAELLGTRSYPGNVRELKQLVARISDRHVGPGPVTVGDVPEDERLVCDPGERCERAPTSFDDVVRGALDQGLGLHDIGRAATDAAVRLAVASENGNLQRAAERLHVTPRALQQRRANQSNGSPGENPDGAVLDGPAVE